MYWLIGWIFAHDFAVHVIKGSLTVESFSGRMLKEPLFESVCLQSFLNSPLGFTIYPIMLNISADDLVWPTENLGKP